MTSICAKVFCLANLYITPNWTVSFDHFWVIRVSESIWSTGSRLGRIFRSQPLGRSLTNHPATVHDLWPIAVPCDRMKAYSGETRFMVRILTSSLSPAAWSHRLSQFTMLSADSSIGSHRYQQQETFPFHPAMADDWQTVAAKPAKPRRQPETRASASQGVGGGFDFGMFAAEPML